MKKLFIFLILLCSWVAVLGQNNKAIDALLIELNANAKSDTTKVITLTKLAQACYGANPEKMLQYADESLELSNQLHYIKGKGEGYKLKGAAYFSKGNFQEAENYFSKALQEFEAINYYKGMVLTLSNMGSIKMVQNIYPEAIAYFQKSLKIASTHNESKLAAYAYGNMGVIYNELKNYPQALQHFNEALIIHKNANNTEGVAANLTNIGNVYSHQKIYDKAIEYFTKGLQINIENKNLLAQAQNYGNVASMYNYSKNFEEAYKYYLLAMGLNETLKNKKGLAVNNHGIGEYFLSQNKPTEAILYLQKANTIAKEVGIKDVEKDSYESLSQAFELKGEKDSAYVYFKKYVAVKEDIDNDAKRKEISKLELQYEFDAKEEKYKTKQILDDENLKQQQLQLQLSDENLKQQHLLLQLNDTKLSETAKERDLVRLNFLKTEADLKTEQTEKLAQKKQLTIAEKELQLKQNEIKINSLLYQTQQKQKYFLLGGLLLLSIIGSLVFYQSYHRKKTNTQLQLLNNNLDEANKTKTRFFSILNHDLRSPVANLIQFLHLQKDSPEIFDEESKSRLQQKTIVGAENLLASMEDILLWSKGQMTNFKPVLKNIAISNLFADTQKHFDSFENVTITFEPTNLQIITDENYLKTIMRNFTSNAIKALEYTANAAINWKADQQNNKTFLSITDNGPGASSEQLKALYDDKEVVGIKSGLGLHLIRDLAKAIHATITTLPNQGNGTTFIVEF
jgi:signal transduction histidine kinase